MFYFILNNKPDENGVAPYKEEGDADASEASRFNLSKKQLDHLMLLKDEIYKIVSEVFSNKNDKLKNDVSRLLDNSLTANFLVGKTLSKSEPGCYNKVQKFLSTVPGVWKVLEHGDVDPTDLMKRYFSDGREGVPERLKSVDEYMMKIQRDLESSAPIGCYAGFLYSDQSSLYEKMDVLEKAYLYIAYTEINYIRGNNDEEYHGYGAVVNFLAGVKETVCGESVPREDIVSPSGTKMFHIEFLQKLYSGLIDKASAEELNEKTIALMDSSRLVKFILAQYQHKLDKNVSDLHIKVQNFLEKDRESLMRHYRKKFTFPEGN